jgi:uncharacterized membrane protein YkgB
MTTSSSLQSTGRWGLRYSLVTNLVWIGALKFKSYEVDNIDPLVSSSPPFAPLRARMSKQRLARLIGVTEILLGSLIAAKPLAPRASAVASLGAAGMFVTTLSFLITTPGVAQESHDASKLSMVGQFLLKDSVLLAASLVTAADSLKAAENRR